ncbi:GNAT family N-acetyltransferase [Methylobrevis albus]|uniref:GNAT family N-acetyltransferase n=1 Tax=Methylobrevis albus TaxID=2793297 RepID=UPI002E2B79E8|nr:GNAT family N-acetyltransferase [Methylobrevis albus]
MSDLGPGTGPLAIGPATPEEARLIVAWAATEGWNPGLSDMEAFYGFDPEGFLVARLGAEMAACISVVAYPSGFGFLGFYICRPDLRGRGIGKALWDAALARRPLASIGLDGVVAQQANYARAGFVFAHRNVRYGGRVAPPSARDPQIEDIAPGSPLAAAVAAYDAGVYPIGRADFVRRWIAAPGQHAVALLGGDAVRGWGAIRPSTDGMKIGPLFADDAAGAAAIFAALAVVADGRPLFVDPPAVNAAAVALAEAHGLVPVFETARMYRGPAPALDLARVFGITSFELG